MKPIRNSEELDSLLGRGGIGATRRDAILQTVLAQATSAVRARARRHWYFAGLGTVAVAAAGLFLLVSRTESPALSPFRAKGVGAKVPATTPYLEIECLGATLKACPTGSLLVVRVAGARGYVSAWAEPLGGGERIWYFSAESHTPLVDSISTASVATRAVQIGPEHAPATYVVEMFVTARPVRRDELMRIAPGATLVSGRAFLTVTSP